MKEQIKKAEYLKSALEQSGKRNAPNLLSYMMQEFIQNSNALGESPIPFASYEKACHLIQAETASQASLSESFIKKLHTILYETMSEKISGQYRKIELHSASYTPPLSGELDHLMEHFLSQLQLSKSMFHPIEYAAICQKRILDMQPFEYGSDHIARLLMNFTLLQQGYPIIIIPSSKKEEYEACLNGTRNAISPHMDPWFDFTTECFLSSVQSYLSFLETI